MLRIVLQIARLYHNLKAFMYNAMVFSASYSLLSQIAGLLSQFALFYRKLQACNEACNASFRIETQAAGL
jgi:hypothetical protein